MLCLQQARLSSTDSPKQLFLDSENKYQQFNRRVIYIIQLHHLIYKFPNFMDLTKFPNFLKLITQINLVIQLGFFSQNFQSVPNLSKYQT